MKRGLKKNEEGVNTNKEWTVMNGGRTAENKWWTRDGVEEDGSEVPIKRALKVKKGGRRGP